MKIHALSQYSRCIQSQITTEITITNIYNGKSVKTVGIWDTGATKSCISKSLADELELKPINRAIVQGVHDSKEVNVFFANFTLLNEQISLNITPTECDELSKDGKIRVLIGMDIINMGDFCITNLGGQTVMSFRVPSLERVDYVEIINQEKRIHNIHMLWAAHGNNKCPCGSGKLYKNCHGKDKE